MADQKTEFPETDPRTRKRYRFQMTPFRAAATQMARYVFLLSSRLHVEGREHIPLQGPLILASNHMTNFDVFPIQFMMDRPIFFMGKAELFKTPLLDWAYRELGGFPVYRGERDEWAMQHAEQVLERGLVLGMFPEGTRNKGTGLRPAKTGAARLAILKDCPILPVGLHGTQHMFKQFPRRADVWIKFGAPVKPQPQETALSLTDRLMFAMAGLLPPEARGVYTYHPDGF